MMFRTIQLCFLGLLLLPLNSFADLQINLTKVATTAKGDFNAFQHLHIPAYANGYYAFLGAGHGQVSLGVFSNVNGYMQDVVTDKTDIPDGSDTFQTFNGVNKSNGNMFGLNQQVLAFIGTGDDNQAGLYRYQQQQLGMVANNKTPIPNGSGYFTEFAYPAVLDDKSIGFEGLGQDGQQGIYMADKVGHLRRLIDITTNIPHGRGKFKKIRKVNFSRGGTIEHPRVVFVGAGTGKQLGLYQIDGRKMRLIANENIEIPHGTGYFTHFESVDYDNDSNAVAFTGGGILSQEGVFYVAGKKLTEVVSSESYIPKGIGTFNRFSEVSVSGDLIAFHGTGNNQVGIYLYSSDGVIYKVLNNRDKIDGRKIKNIYISPNSLDKNHLAVLVDFTNNTQTIYVVSLSFDNN